MSLGSINEGALQKAWDAHKTKFDGENLKVFEQYACTSLDAYVDKLVEACKSHQDAHIRHKIYAWFEPILQAVKTLMPFAESALKSSPIPGGAIPGGIVAIICIAERLFEYQKRTMQMLGEIGDRLQSLLAYERDIYDDVDFVKTALVLVYGDILEFCSEAFQFLTVKGDLRARIKGFRFMTFQTFENRLGKVVDSFRKNMAKLEARAHDVDKLRLKEIRDLQETQNTSLGQAFDKQKDYFKRSDEIQRRIEAKLEKIEKEKANKEIEKAKQRTLEWLSPLKVSAIYEEITVDHVEGTGGWLLAHQAYCSWKSTDKSELLWVKGKHGCGKSYLAARTIQDLALTVEDTGSAAYIFCRRGDRTALSRLAILGSLAKQIIDRQSKSIPVLDDEFRAKQRPEIPNIKFIKQVLKEAIVQANTTFLVIDGLDECSDEVSLELASDLVDMIKDQDISSLKIVVFSRPDVGFEERFGTTPEIRPDHGDNLGDLKTYVDSVFDDEHGKIEISDELRKKVVEKAQGMFQWVYLFRKSIQNPVLRSRRLKNIDAMKSGLEPFYDEALTSIDKDLRPTTWIIFLWITHGKRALSGVEMREAVTDMGKALRLKDLESDPTDGYLVFICANLIFIDRNGFVRLIHDSVRTYLESTDSSGMSEWRVEYQKLLGQVHEILSKVCLKYLLLQDFERGPALSITQQALMHKKAPFLKYSAATWAWHVSRVADPTLMTEEVGKLVNSKPRRDLCMQIYFNDDAPALDLAPSGMTNPLQLLASVGLVSQAKLLIGDIVKLARERDSRGHNALTFSTRWKHDEMTLWLIETISESQEGNLTSEETEEMVLLSAGNGWERVLESLLKQDKYGVVNVHVVDEEYTPLMRACGTGNVECARVLIQYNADVNKTNRNGETALLFAALYEKVSAVSLLLDNHAKPSIADKDGWTALHYAADSSNEEMAELLLNAGANAWAEAQAGDNQTPLHIAAERQATGVIRAILKLRPEFDINKTCKGKYTPLHVAAWHNSAAAAALLVELNCDIDYLDEDSQTALSSEGAVETVRVLVDKGANVRLPIETGRTALHAAAGSGKKGLLEYMVRAQPPETWKDLLNIPDVKGATVIHLAIIGDDIETINFALSAGADGTKEGALSSSPLHYAAHFGHKAMILPLLRSTRNPNPRNIDQDTPLHFAARIDKVEIIRELVRACAEEGLPLEIDATNTSLSTPLTSALGSGCSEAAEFLLKEGAKSVKAKNGNWPVHLATWDGDERLVRILLDHPGVLDKSYAGRNLLHCAAASGRLSVIQLILGKSVKGWINERDDYGHTPVMLGLLRGHIEATHYLMDLQPDWKVKNMDEENLLHMAARHGDIDLFKRLILISGIDVKTQTKFGYTPLLLAIDHDKTAISDELMKIGGIHAMTSYTGFSCQHAAAGRGNVTLLEQLHSLGADLDQQDLMGRRPMHMAAEGGHYEALVYLNSKGCSCHKGDLNDSTPLLFAVGDGQLKCALFLIRQSTPADINHFQSGFRASAITVAAARGYSELIRPLLSAGADPFHQDAAGLTAIDYALMRPHIFLIFAGEVASLKLTEAATSQRIVRQTVSRASQLVKDIAETQVSVTELFNRTLNIILLGTMLRRIDDYETAELCLMERRWRPRFSLVSETILCNHCTRKSFEGDIYVCKSCKIEWILCERCHTEYNDNGKQRPPALNEIRTLEEKLRKIRMLIPEEFSVFEATMVMTFFHPELWMSSTIDEYEKWQQKYNAKGEYVSLERPGQVLLGIIEESDRLMQKPIASNETLAKSLHERYEKLLRDHPPSKLQSQHDCSGHEYFVVKEDRCKELKAEGILLDKETGRLTEKLLQSIREKYQNAQESLEDPVIDTSRGVPPQERSVATESSDLATQAAEKPHHLTRAMTALNLSHSIGTSALDAQAEEIPNMWIRRANTLPNLSDSKPTPMPPPSQEVNDMRTDVVQTANQIILDPSQRENNLPLLSAIDSTQAIDLQTPVDVTQDNQPGNSAAPVQGIPAPEAVQEEDLLLAMIQNPTEQNLTVENLRLAYLSLHPRLTSDDTIAFWYVALRIAEQIFPGFCEGYRQQSLLEMGEELVEEMNV